MYMTNNFLIVLSLALLSLCFEIRQQQGYKVYYKMTFQKDSNNAVFQSEIAELLINGKQSLFRSVSRAERDTNEFYPDLQNRPYSYTHTETNYRILKDYAAMEIQFYEKVETFRGPIRTYSELNKNMAWQLTDDTLTIDNYLCQKAKLDYGNRSWEAWFCPDIPISDGPYKFWGLPGLIVLIRDTTGSWTFDLVKIEYIQTFELGIYFLKDSEVIDKKAFYKYKRYYIDNYVQIVETEGNIEFPTEEIRQDNYRKGKENAAKNNNWIELYP